MTADPANAGAALTAPEQHLPHSPRVCHDHWSGFGEDGWAECCLCGDNPCEAVTVADAVRHGEYRYWRGQLDGVFLARSVLSDAIAAAAPPDRPTGVSDEVYDAAVEAFHAAWVIVRGDVDEPPF